MTIPQIAHELKHTCGHDQGPHLQNEDITEQVMAVVTGITSITVLMKENEIGEATDGKMRNVLIVKRSKHIKSIVNDGEDHQAPPVRLVKALIMPKMIKRLKLQRISLIMKPLSQTKKIHHKKLFLCQTRK